MITLKLGIYNEKEREALEQLLNNSIAEIYRLICKHQSSDCCKCEYRHLCTDLVQSHLYAKDYKVTNK